MNLGERKLFPVSINLKLKFKTTLKHECRQAITATLPVTVTVSPQKEEILLYYITDVTDTYN